MNSQMRRKASLLSRVSTLAVIAAAGGLGAVQQAQAACDTPLVVNPAGQTITGAHQCATVNFVTGDVINNGTIGPPGDGDPGFFVGKGGLTGTLTNNSIITGGGFGDFTGGGEGSTLFGALTIVTNVSGGVRNDGQISSVTGNGIQLGTAQNLNITDMTGVITNSGVVTSTLGDGVAALYGSTSGGLVNEDDGTISGGNRAVYIADSFTSWSGGIRNSGQILGNAAGIQIGNTGGEGTVDFSGGITNDSGGTINSLTGPTILVGGNSFSGGIDNFGEITQRDETAAGGEGTYTGVGIVVSSETFNDGIENYGSIRGLGGPAIWITADTTTFNGGIQNHSLIDGSESAIVIASDTFNGGLFNDTFATIVGASGDGVSASTTTWDGTFENRGTITGSNNGFSLIGVGGEGSSFAGDILNTGQITGTNGNGVFISVDGPITAAGGEGVAEFRNTGRIDAGSTGFYVLGDTVTANFTNNSIDPINNVPPGNIVAQSGAAVVLAANTSWQGNITNDGTISGAAGMVVNAIPFFSDGFTANATTGTYSGTITNNGVMEGDAAGLYIGGSSVTGNLNNAGTMSGFGSSLAAGLVVDVGTWSGNISNTGTMQGSDTGAYIRTNTFTGDITNDGVISGFSSDTGLHIITTGTHTGNIVNNDLISASGNALHVEIGTLVGSIVNTGTIEATVPGAEAVLLEVGNGTSFVNTGHGLILGDVVFGGKAAYEFVAENGGIEGQIFGVGDSFGGEGGEGGGANDDIVTVQNGTHFFFFEGKGAGVNNFAQFNVEDGGTAVMGAHFVGDTVGSTGFTFNNVDNVNVNGGTLYIDKSATLAVNNNYTQEADGTLMYYLGAPAGISGLTGTVVADPNTDYGQIHVGGTATLDGIIAGYLDPNFGSANPDLESVTYNNVLVADGGITGDFSTLALINSNSIFQLDQIIDGNTVDLRVSHTADIGHLGNLPGIVVEVAGPWKSMVNDRSNGIGSGSCGLAGSGWCFNQFAQNEVGAGQVMTDATPGDDPFGWLRTGVRRVGETAVWGRAVGVWGETDGDAGSAGTDFDIAGGIVGVDHVFSPMLLAGVAGQWTTSDIDFNGLPDNASVDSLELGAYMSYGDTRLYLNANASFIWHDIEVNRFGAGTAAFGDYDGTTVSGYVEAGKIFETQSGFRIQPLVALSYAHLETDAYSETGTGTLLNVFDSDFDTLKSNIGARFAYPIAMKSGRKLVPEARVVWAHEFLDDQSSFLATIQGGLPTPSLIVGEEYSRDTLILGAGVTAPLSDSTTLFIDYDAGLNEDITTHTVSAGFRTRW